MTAPPLPPNDLTRRLREYNDRLETFVHVQAIRREHAKEREELALATLELSLWRKGLATK